MLVGIERQAHRRNAADAVLAEHLVNLALGGFDTSDQPLELVILAQFGGHGIDCAAKIVSHRQDIAGKAGRGVGAGIGNVLFRTAADVLRLCLGVERFLFRRLEIVAQFGQRIFHAGVIAIRIVRVGEEFFRHTLQFVFDSLIQRLLLLVAHNLPYLSDDLAQ